METIAPHTMNLPPQHVREWFQRRSITQEVLDLFRISWDGRIVIPVFSPQGEFLFNKYRRDPASQEGPKYTYDAGGKVALYGAHLLGEVTRVIITEGEIDALFLRSLGYDSISSTGGAGSFSPSWIELLYDREVVICYDNDEAGIRGALKVQKYIRWATIAQLPRLTKVKDVSDFGEYCVARGTSTFMELGKIFNAAQSYDCDEIMVKADDTLVFKRGVNAQYLARIATMRNLRSNASRVGSGDTLFYDILIADQQTYIEDVKRLMRKKKVFTGKNEKSVEAARAVPITNYIKFNRQGMAKCLWHKEDTASMHYMRDANKVHCFGGCGTKNVVDVVMVLNTCSFSDALEKLL